MRRYDTRITNGDVWYRNLTELLLGTYQDKLSLIVIKFYKVVVHPLTDFIDTRFNTFNTRVGIRLDRPECKIQLSIISIYMILQFVM